MGSVIYLLTITNIIFIKFIAENNAHNIIRVYIDILGILNAIILSTV